MTLDAALYLALTGEPLQGGATLPEALREHGWDPARLRAHAARCRADERPWPHPVPPESRTGVGAAQFQGALHQALSSLGLLGAPALPGAARPLTADERRLLSDVPPHHGS